jgi:hypothetical protein
MNIFEEIFSENLIRTIPDLHEAICTGIIKDKSRNIAQIPTLSYWLTYYRNSKSIF